ncbi:ABC transporter G family member 22 [Dorcoceras hygrometricum]|uniref:ABC transporter G family member 22 n=1 Tax=Dorcoceras hygrometricum TaxID=472368 RepID=A0A2Z7CNC9_9LAMI|nr:ABC transporter G family member 22 [Dorcoceras hygrometricum]
MTMFRCCELLLCGLLVPEKSNAIVGVVTTGFECLPPSCDGLTGLDDHGPMISRLIDRGVSGNQAGPSGSSVGRSPHP